MFAPPPPEALPEYEKDRNSHTEDADRLREHAFKVQEWTSQSFGIRLGPVNQYRITLKNGMYYLESISDARYCGLMIPEQDLYSLTNTLVAASKAKKALE